MEITSASTLRSTLYAFALLHSTAHASLAEFPGLTDPQREAAVALQAIYEELRLRESDLDDSEQRIYREAQRLVHTANELLANGNPTAYSLNLDAEGLAFALQWVAPEEVNTQGRVSSSALGIQLANVASRMESFRTGVQGVMTAGLGPGAEDISSYRSIALTGGTAGDPGSVDDGWAVYLNGGFSVGDREPTPNEDALDFDSYGITLGVDYRLSPRWVLGAAIGHSRSEADFDSSQSVVDGRVEARSWTSTFYSATDWTSAYLNAVFSYGQTDIETVRRISYPSNNPLIPGADETALGDTTGHQYTLSVNGGVDLLTGALNLVWQGDLSYSKNVIKAYRERNADVFNLGIGQQEIESLTLATGPQVNYVFSFRHGVIIPQVRVKLLKELDDNPAATDVRFLDDSTSTAFSVTSDTPDTEYLLASFDVSAVFPHGLQAFASYTKPFALNHIDFYSVTAGVRWEF